MLYTVCVSVYMQFYFHMNKMQMQCINLSDLTTKSRKVKVCVRVMRKWAYDIYSTHYAVIYMCCAGNATTCMITLLHDSAASTVPTMVLSVVQLACASIFTHNLFGLNRATQICLVQRRYKEEKHMAENTLPHITVECLILQDRGMYISIDHNSIRFQQKSRKCWLITSLLIK